MGERDIFPETKIKDDTRWYLLQEKAMAVRALRAFTLLRDKGIEPILIKGLAAARYYPQPGSRVSLDTDLAVSADDFEAARAIATSEAARGIGTDLHCELRHLDTVDWKDLFANSQTLVVDGGDVRVLRPEDHLRVLSLHWLTNGGDDKDRLWDIYYAVENRAEDFDWDRFLNPVSERRRRWLICTVGLAHHFLGLNLDDTPIKNEAVDLPRWLVRTVEKEWAREVSLLPLQTILHDPKLLLQQIRKRVPPNPIMATVQMEGSFDARTRFFYQVGNIFQRLMPSYKRISETIMSKGK